MRGGENEKTGHPYLGGLFCFYHTVGAMHLLSSSSVEHHPTTMLSGLRTFKASQRGGLMAVFYHTVSAMHFKSRFSGESMVAEVMNTAAPKSRFSGDTSLNCR